MNIQYYGHSCFKITSKPGGRATEDVVIMIDPFDKSVGLRPPQGQADIVLISHPHPDHNNIAAVKGEPFVIDTAGEYSVKGINIIGLDSYHDDKEGAERGKNTIFLIESEDVHICHMGDLGCDLTAKQIEDVNGVDVLMIPVGGNYTIDGKKAAEITRKIEPAIVIPMHYKEVGSTVEVEDETRFCKEAGNCPSQKVSKLTFKKKDLEGKSEEVVLMSVE